jgi:type II secretory pathway pseudopilin PulG
MYGGKQLGFTYVAALLAVAIVTAGASVAAVAWSNSIRRDREAELVWIGSQFVIAIKQYYERSPGSIKQYPTKLEHLLEDPRYVSTERYLRRIYLDPTTRHANWGLVAAPDGGIAGVHSLSGELAVQRSVFPGTQLKYSDWKFVYTPQTERK